MIPPGVNPVGIPAFEGRDLHVRQRPNDRFELLVVLRSASVNELAARMLHGQPPQEIKMDQIVPQVPLVERVVNAAAAGLLSWARDILTPDDAGDAAGVI